MPELPEVETIARELAPVLTGKTFERVFLTRTDVVHGTDARLERVLPNRRITRIARRAKRLVFDLHPSTQLIFHLGMSGRITLAPPNLPLEPHTHLRLTFRGVAQELRFCDPRRFGGVWYFEPGKAIRDTGRTLGPLGIEPLEATRTAFRALLRRNRQIKALLLDQTAIAGLGNIYCDESLHRARVHPRTLASSLSTEQADELLRAIKFILRSAIRHNGTTLKDYRTANGQPGSFQEHHRVYQCEGRPCRTCGALIEHSTVAGRSTFRCPACQQEPASRLCRPPYRPANSNRGAKRRTPTRKAIVPSRARRQTGELGG